jgi:sugar lactone lactonase YvrE
MSCRPDGTNFEELVTGLQTLPDGIAIDTQSQKLYWTNMGESMVNDGFIQRCDLSGANIVTIIPSGVTHTPKQLEIFRNQIYWCDREDMRVMRANLDGSHVEFLHQAGSSYEDREDRRNWCVGIAVDDVRGKLYWS